MKKPIEMQNISKITAHAIFQGMVGLGCGYEDFKEFWADMQTP